MGIVQLNTMEREGLEALKAQLLEVLKKEAFFREKIVLSSGKTSDYYVDGRLVTLSPQGAYLTASVMLELLKGDTIQAIGGPTVGADPIVGAIAALSFINKAPVNTFIVRKTPKPHGKMRQIEGPLLAKGSRVVVIDDVATTGKSLVESIQILRQQGVEVVKAMVILDRDEGAKEALAKEQCPLVSIFHISQLLKWSSAP